MAAQSKLQIAYREFFNAMLGEYGVKSPGALGDKKSEFFKKIKKEWPTAKKKIQEGVLRQTIRSIIAEVLDEGKPAPDHFKKLAQVIVDKKGNFSASDFKKLNIPFEIFLQMAQMDNNVLVKNAEKVLKLAKEQVSEAEESKQITITDKSGNKLSATKTMTSKQFWAYEKKMKNKMSTSSGKTEISSINTDWKKGEINIK